MAKILFSPVGFSDPIKDNYDGPMLHIIRHIKPDNVYLFFTRETGEYERDGNRYTETIKRCGINCRIITLFNDDITDPSDFDIFLKHYPRIFNEILSSSCNEDEIYANISSGTPQMIGALCLYITENPANRRIFPVQVTTPKKKANQKQSKFNVDDEVNNLIDNDPNNITKRIAYPELNIYKKQIVLSQIRSLIQMYDYNGAYEIAASGAGLFKESKTLLKLIEHARQRLCMKADDARKCISDMDGLDFNFYPINEKTVQHLDDYLSAIKVKQKRGELADFIMKVTPFVTELIKEYYKKINLLDELSKTDNNKVLLFSKEKIERFNPQMLINIEKSMSIKTGEFRDHFFNISTASHILNYLFSNDNNSFGISPKVRKNLNLIRPVEQKIRHKNAHEMVSVTEENFKSKEMGGSSLGIVKILEEMMAGVFEGHYDKNRVFIYDDINRIIIKNLE